MRLEEAVDEVIKSKDECVVLKNEVTEQSKIINDLSKKLSEKEDIIIGLEV